MSTSNKNNIEETILSFLSDLNNNPSSSSSTLPSITTTTKAGNNDNDHDANLKNVDRQNKESTKEDGDAPSKTPTNNIPTTHASDMKDESSISSFLIPEWRASTTHALLSPHPRHLTPQHHQQHSQYFYYYNILDHVFDHTFPQTLLQEIQSKNLLKKLQPAKTASDDKSSSFYKNFIKEEAETKARYDDSIFIARSLRSSPNFCNTHPCLYKLISSIEQSALHHFSSAKQKTKIKLDVSMTSVQLARYEANTKGGGYRKHCDDGLSCQHESSSSDKKEGDASSRRVITAVYYLTPSDWDKTLDNGCLRLYSPFGGDEKYEDVIPYPNRLVLFRSDVVEHEVLPTLRRDRIAITVWLYGWIVHAEKEKENILETEISTLSKEGLLPLPPPSPSSITNFKIFLAIPSYRDTETHPTILSLLQNATHPQNIHVAVVYQVDTEHDQDAAVFQPPLPHPWCITNFTSTVINYKQAKGPCYARFLAQQLLRHHYPYESSLDDEKQYYLLQIDSHMRFRKHWDIYLISQFLKIPGIKHVLTAYPVGYTLPFEGRIEKDETRGTLLVPSKIDVDGMLRQRGRLVTPPPSSKNTNDNDNIKCQLYAGGFNFSHYPSVIQDCPYDGTLSNLFFGEEVSMAVRLYTLGYDLYCPPVSVCYHLWDRGDRKTIHTSDNNENDVGDNNNWEEERREAQRVVLEQVRGGGRGLGSVRIAKEWADEIGVDFEQQLILPGAENGVLKDSKYFAMPFTIKNGIGMEVEGNGKHKGGNSDDGFIGDDENVRDLVAAFLG